MFCSLCRVASPTALRVHSFPSLVMLVLASKTHNSASHDALGMLQPGGPWVSKLREDPMVSVSKYYLNNSAQG